MAADFFCGYLRGRSLLLSGGLMKQRWQCSWRGSEGSRDVWLLGCLRRCSATKNRVCGGLGYVLGVAGGLGCAEGLRRSRCGCSGGPTSRNGGFSPLKQPTTTHNFAWPASVTCSMSRPQISKIDFIFN